MCYMLSPTLPPSSSLPSHPQTTLSSSLLYRLHALSLVLFAWSALLCPKRTPTHAARAGFESFLLHEGFTPLEVPKPTQSPAVWP